MCASSIILSFRGAGGDEESRTAMKILRARFFAPLRMTEARFFAEFTLSTQSEILRFAQDDSEGLRMTAKGSE